MLEQFNPILCRPCVHHGTFLKVLIDNFCSSKHREIIIFAHNYFKTKNNKATLCLKLHLSIFFLVKG